MVPDNTPVTLQPVSMARPAEQCIYAPDRTMPNVETTAGEVRRRAEPVALLLSLDPDGRSNPRRVLALAMGWYYIVTRVGNRRLEAVVDVSPR